MSAGIWSGGRRLGRGAKPKERVELALMGAAAGLGGTALMTAAQERLFSKVPPGPSLENMEPRFPSEPESRDEVATETAARRLYQGLAHRRLPARRKKLAGNLVHFGIGAAWGALYGLLTPRRPGLVDGLAFGGLVWLLSDNLLVPTLRLGDWAWRYPLGSNAKGLLAHLAYGVGSAAALRAQLRWL